MPYTHLTLPTHTEMQLSVTAITFILYTVDSLAEGDGGLHYPPNNITQPEM